MKNTLQSRNDSAHQRTLQKPSTPQSVKWVKDPGIDHPQVQNKFGIEDDNDTEKSPQTRA